MALAEFQYLSALLKKRSGLALTEDKGYLVESRLLPIARNLGLTSVADLIVKIKAAPTEDLLTQITEAMTTNESLFFRDAKPFQYLRETLLPEYKIIAGKNSLRIWSAACSTGQEPYSIGICLQEESLKMPGWKYEIIATDLATKVIEKAKEGIYTQFEIQRGLPIQMLIKYFTQTPGTASWQVKDIVRNMVKYRALNLLEDITSLGKLDIIFCRNVLIYFDDPTKGAIVERMAKLLPKGGYIFIGSTETLVDKSQLFSAVEQCRGLYKLK